VACTVGSPQRSLASYHMQASTFTCMASCGNWRKTMALRNVIQLYPRWSVAAAPALLARAQHTRWKTVRRRAHCWDHYHHHHRTTDFDVAAAAPAAAGDNMDAWETKVDRKQSRFIQRQPRIPSQGVVSTIYSIVRAEGVRALYRGLSLNFIKAAPTVGISFAVYEKMRQWLKLPASSSSTARPL
jgi:hypothetical protein